MASWRLKQFKNSRAHFDAVARSEYASPWIVSAGAFWAARASIKVRKPEDFSRYLEMAAEHPRTFYGLLGSFLLNRKVNFNWAPPPLAKQAVAELAMHRVGAAPLLSCKWGRTFGRSGSCAPSFHQQNPSWRGRC